jgi:hypothetical protein
MSLPGLDWATTGHALAIVNRQKTITEQFLGSTVPA